VPVDACTKSEALQRCATAIEGTGTPLQVVTLNPEMVMQARRNHELGDVIRGAGLVLADGSGITWATSKLGSPLPERIPGVDFLQALCAEAALRQWGVFLLGAAPGVAAEAGRELVSQSPGLRVSGTASGSKGEGEAAELCRRVRDSGADMVAVAFGVPGQEIWLSRHLAETGCRLGMGVGGALDYISGRVPRAPLWMRRAGLEWSFRLLHQPARLPRMLRGSLFFAAVKSSARGGGPG
jgi:N-acetylglucosaminyldiphosphoundecaprenol N-acetyl-beta-D-mannosaminyltransferase